MAQFCKCSTTLFSGRPLGHDELVARRRAVVDSASRTAQTCSGRRYRREAVAILSGSSIVLAAVPHSRVAKNREHVLDRVGSYMRRSRGSCGGAQPLAFGRLALVIMMPFCRRNTEKSGLRRVGVGCVFSQIFSRVGIEGQVLRSRGVAVLQHTTVQDGRLGR